MDRAKEFRTASDRLNAGRRGTGRRYTEELRSLAVAHGEQRRLEGWGWSAIAEELEVCPATLLRWRDGSTQVGFRPVQVVEPVEVPAEEDKPLVAITPGGLRIEGLSWSEMLELARVLG